MVRITGGRVSLPRVETPHVGVVLALAFLHVFGKFSSVKLQFQSVRPLLLGAVLAVPVGLLAGSASALFLGLLDWATATRIAQPWLLFLLPIAGLLLGVLNHWVGKSAEGGNNLILEQIHTAGGGIPRRMAPLILFSTVYTHLFGGSAGREGTAVQMGGSIAASCCSLFKLEGYQRKLLLLAGVAGGFGSVFGTPLAGALFAIEVLTIGRLELGALLPVLVAGFVGDWACSAWGIRHTTYHIAISSAAGPGMLKLLGWAALVGGACGLVAHLFAESAHRIQQLFGKLRWSPVRPLLGGLLIIVLTYALGTRDYLGLGVSSADPAQVTILSAFEAGGATPWSWLWKLLFTVVTLGSGFKGGEVTPLFFIGSTLGNALAMLVGAPPDLCAALGLVALFAGAANTPVACTIMGLELFGLHYGASIALACVVAFLCSGHSGIYLSQRLHLPATGHISLADARRAGRKLLKLRW